MTERAVWLVEYLGEVARDASTRGLRLLAMAFYDIDQVSSEQPASPVTVGISNVQVLAGPVAGDDPGAPGYRNGLLLQNSGASDTIYIVFGSTAATTSAYHYALAPGASVGFGALGASQGIWRGAVQAIGSAAGCLLAMTVC